MKLFSCLVALVSLVSACSTAQPTRTEYFSNWPAGTSPAEVGKRVAENYLPRKFRYETNPAKASLGIIYPEVIGWYGSLTVAKLSGDTNFTARLIAKFEPLLT